VNIWEWSAEENILALVEEKQLRNVEYFNWCIGSPSGKRGKMKHELIYV
jgi:hypothetical protein